jgi:hypothetical protein
MTDWDQRLHRGLHEAPVHEQSIVHDRSETSHVHKRGKALCLSAILMIDMQRRAAALHATDLRTCSVRFYDAILRASAALKQRDHAHARPTSFDMTN